MPVVSASRRCTNLRNFSPRDRAQKSPAPMDDTRAACKFQFVFCHECGTSIQPRGLSIAITERSSYRIGTCRRSEEHTSELQSHVNLVCRLLLEKKKKQK